ncbi:hypothetical protein EAF04_004727 [Stromatinia cepivora]|nr:hypothetical protein EAF04_004727 [Stromatinia cepivora]
MPKHPRKNPNHQSRTLLFPRTPHPNLPARAPLPDLVALHESGRLFLNPKAMVERATEEEVWGTLRPVGRERGVRRERGVENRISHHPGDIYSDFQEEFQEDITYNSDPTKQHLDPHQSNILTHFSNPFNTSDSNSNSNPTSPMNPSPSPSPHTLRQRRLGLPDLRVITSSPGLAALKYKNKNKNKNKNFHVNVNGNRNMDTRQVKAKEYGESRHIESFISLHGREDLKGSEGLEGLKQVEKRAGVRSLAREEMVGEDIGWNVQGKGKGYRYQNRSGIQKSYDIDAKGLHTSRQSRTIKMRKTPQTHNHTRSHTRYSPRSTSPKISQNTTNPRTIPHSPTPTIPPTLSYSPSLSPSPQPLHSQPYLTAAPIPGPLTPHQYIHAILTLRQSTSNPTRYPLPPSISSLLNLNSNSNPNPDFFPTTHNSPSHKIMDSNSHITHPYNLKKISSLTLQNAEILALQMEGVEDAIRIDGVSEEGREIYWGQFAREEY